MKVSKNELFYIVFICFEVQANMEQKHNLNIDSWVPEVNT